VPPNSSASTASRFRAWRPANRADGDAAGALGDDHEVDDDEDEKNHHPDDVAATHHEAAERLDDVTGRRRALGAVQQDEACRGDVQRQAQQRRDQQHRREGRELERFERVHRDQEDDQRDGDVDGQQQVEQHRRQGDDHDDHHHDEGERDHQLAAGEHPSHHALRGRLGRGHYSRAPRPARRCRRPKMYARISATAR
jgi:hypothetical protein